MPDKEEITKNFTSEKDQETLPGSKEHKTIERFENLTDNKQTNECQTNEDELEKT